MTTSYNKSYSYFVFHRLTLAVNQTYFLALKFYDNLQISASCVAFLEMLNEPTKKLRLLLSSAHLFQRGKQLADKHMETRAVHFYVGKIFSLNTCSS